MCIRDSSSAVLRCPALLCCQQVPGTARSSPWLAKGALAVCLWVVGCLSLIHISEPTRLALI
eukprot:2975596-Alexandrium_andersonii.AAC.1